MATYKIGDRVRFKAGTYSESTGTYLGGHEAVILDNGLGMFAKGGKTWEWYVMLIGVGSRWLADSCEFEPPISDSNQIVAWDECPFTKEGKWVGGEVTA